MSTTLNPYLNFRGDARKAMEFYRDALGGELTVSTFEEFGAADAYPGEGDKVMHAQLTTPSGFTLMASDTPSSMELTVGDSISVSLSGDNEAELRGYWEKLSAGADIGQPLVAAPWGDQFGSLKDQFGVNWLVNISAPAAG